MLFSYLKDSMHEIAQKRPLDSMASGVAGGGGAARTGCQHFGVTPFYDVKP